MQVGCQLVFNDATLQSFIYKHTEDLKNVQRNKKKKKKENSQDVKLAQTRCQLVFNLRKPLTNSRMGTIFGVYKF
jgi:hypothetical protein